MHRYGKEMPGISNGEDRRLEWVQSNHSEGTFKCTVEFVHINSAADRFLYLQNSENVLNLPIG